MSFSWRFLFSGYFMENWENPIVLSDYTVYFVFKVHAMNVIFLLVFVLVLVDFDFLSP